MTTEFDKVFDQMEAPEYPATCDNCGEIGTNATMEQHECAEQPAQRERSKGMTTGLPPRTDHEFVPLPPPNEHLLACARCFRPRAAHEQPRPEQRSETTITKQSDLFPRYTFAVVMGRYKILDNRSDSEPRVQQIATADSEDEARLIVNALNAIAHHDAPAAPERGERWIYGHYAGRAKGFYVNRVHPDDSDLQTRVADIKYHEDDERNEAEIRARQIITEHNQHSTFIAQREQLLTMLKQFVSPTQCYCDKLLYERGPRKCGQCEARELITTIEQEGTEKQ